jgi:hypothetical protein
MLPDKQFIELINNSTRMKDVLLFFGVSNKGGNFNTVNNRIAHLGLNKDHMMGMRESSIIGRTMTMDEFKTNWLVENSQKDRGTIKRNLLKFSILDWECSECKNTGFWKNKSLTLQLEHKNGVSNDHRLENLCFLCPNCHSQTSTYAGKRSKPKAQPKVFICTQCGNQKKIKRSKVCTSCNGRNKHKINWPDDQLLCKLVQENSLLGLGKKLGVSDNAIKKYCKHRNINLKKLP